MLAILRKMRHIPIDAFDYTLPEDRIATYPLKKRDESKLLVYKGGDLSSDTFSDIANYIPERSLLVFNNTRVIQARLLFNKDTGAEIEIFCLEPHDPADYYKSFQAVEQCNWVCIIGNSKKWKDGVLIKELKVNKKTVQLKAERKVITKENVIISFSWNSSNISFSDILESAGSTPIPPYLKRKSEQLDKERYQTIYSAYNGSVAAPTAGLHFTKNVFYSLYQKNILTQSITLHVGAGTFKPVKESNAALHSMHAEHFYVKKEFLEQLIRYKGNVTSVGTTSLRALESIYWIGVKLKINPESELLLDQWEAYSLPQDILFEEALLAILHFFNNYDTNELEAITSIMVVPGYKFRVVNRLITNFHQPKSTLLLLVAAFIGEQKWEIIYNYALENNFRFLSYGDSSILIP